jgi:hypothetical protein
MTLVQGGAGLHAELLKLSGAHHKRWAERHGLEYRAVLGDIDPEAGPRAQKVLTMLSVLEELPPGDVLLWLDADALVVRDVDPRPILENADLGMAYLRDHYCLGCVFARNVPAVRAWLVELGVDDCYRANELLQAHGLACRDVGAVWNSQVPFREKEPVVMHWSRRPKASVLRDMAAELSAVGKTSDGPPQMAS